MSSSLPYQANIPPKEILCDSHMKEQRYTQSTQYAMNMTKYIHIQPFGWLFALKRTFRPDEDKKKGLDLFICPTLVSVVHHISKTS